jgi:signal transduction histidine kinase
VQAMGGEARVAASSTGTEFTICLPLAESENELDALHAFTQS